MSIPKVLSLVDEAHAIAIQDGDYLLAYILQLASLAASERIEQISNQELLKKQNERGEQT